jgi:hypothetical protein
MKHLVVAVLGALFASPAYAQSAYVAGTIGAEIVRTTVVKSTGSTYDGGSGEAFAGSLRIGALVAPRFGVELEFHRPATIDADTNGPIYIAAGVRDAVAGGLVAEGLVTDASSLAIISQDTRVRVTTTSALAFARQSVGSRVDLVYLGGAGFSRVVHEIEFGVPRGLVPLGQPVLAPYRTRTTQYGVGPVVGVEARVGMTDHARLVAGVRLHALGQSLVDGWLVRPSVGLAWMF